MGTHTHTRDGNEPGPQDVTVHETAVGAWPSRESETKTGQRRTDKPTHAQFSRMKPPQ